MGRKKRHSSRTGDGGAELRLQKQRAAAAEREQKEAELAFYDDPSEDEHDSEHVDSDGSEYGNGDGALELGADNSDAEDDSDDDDENDDEEMAVDDDDDDNAEDFEGQKKKILQMDGKWGKSKKNFYSADTAEFELDSDEEAAKDEEDAALELQRKQADMMDDEDFGFDGNAATDDDDDEEDAGDDDAAPIDDEDLVGAQLADISMLADSGDGAIERVHKDFSKMSKKDKLQIVNQSAPELLGLMNELEATMQELKDVVTPAIQKLKGVRRKTRAFNSGLQYLVTKQNLMLNYVSNISFYLLLRAEGKSVTDHPVLQHLLLVKKQMQKLAPVDDAVASALQDLLTKDFPLEAVENDGMDQFFSATKQKTAATKQKNKTTATASAPPAKKQKTKSAAAEDAERAEAAKFYEAALQEKKAALQSKQAFYTHEKPGLASSDDDDDSDLEDAKRGATYEIIKNKGLKAHKSKLNRNPRVKKRMQFRKAVIRRKGQVRDVRVGEASKYGGETTGIKANLTRSRKIRN